MFDVLLSKALLLALCCSEAAGAQSINATGILLVQSISRVQPRGQYSSYTRIATRVNWCINLVQEQDVLASHVSERDNNTSTPRHNRDAFKYCSDRRRLFGIELYTEFVHHIC